jgi:DNA-binding PadR family transcriptional regulator
MADQGRIYWSAAPSQWYAEPKRLAQAGYLESRKGPGQTRERTHYTLTEKGREALEEWVRTPAELPRIQQESVVRLLAGDLVDPAAVREGLSAMRAEIDEAAAAVDRARSQWQPALPHRAHLLDVNHRYAAKMLDLQREWLGEAEAVLQEGETGATNLRHRDKDRGAGPT